MVALITVLVGFQVPRHASSEEKMRAASSCVCRTKESFETAAKPKQYVECTQYNKYHIRALHLQIDREQHQYCHVSGMHWRACNDVDVGEPVSIFMRSYENIEFIHICTRHMYSCSTSSTGQMAAATGSTTEAILPWHHRNRVESP